MKWSTYANLAIFPYEETAQEREELVHDLFSLIAYAPSIPDGLWPPLTLLAFGLLLVITALQCLEEYRQKPVVVTAEVISNVLLKIPVGVLPSGPCTICKERFISPISTVCSHVFCDACIRLALSQQDDCPLCTQPLLTTLNMDDGRPHGTTFRTSLFVALWLLILAINTSNIPNAARRSSIAHHLLLTLSATATLQVFAVWVADKTGRSFKRINGGSLMMMSNVVAMASGNSEMGLKVMGTILLLTATPSLWLIVEEGCNAARLGSRWFRWWWTG
ncbi:hypothetical protein LTR85_002611 [Meristemomyces frigidus]|nr:hypothetical protein LTR85_002611 [Meristemomyces frigidus]